MWNHHHMLGYINFADPHSLPVHPTQLYHSAVALLIFGALTVYLRTQQRKPGQVFLLFGVLYALGRFPIEFLRDDMTRTCGLTAYQILAIPVFIVSVVWWCVLQFRTEQTDSP